MDVSRKLVGAYSRALLNTMAAQQTIPAAARRCAMTNRRASAGGRLRRVNWGMNQTGTIAPKHPSSSQPAIGRQSISSTTAIRAAMLKGRVRARRPLSRRLPSGDSFGNALHHMSAATQSPTTREDSAAKPHCSGMPIMEAGIATQRPLIPS